MIHDLAQALMDTVFGLVPGVLRFLQSGVSTNWWGLACPSHCGASALPLVLAAFLCGFCSCLCLATFITLWTLGFSLPSFATPSAAHPSARLARYLNGSARARPRGN